MFRRFRFAVVLWAVLMAAQACDNGSTVATGPSGPLNTDPTTPGPSAGCLDSAGNPLPVAPDSQRVDLATPTFSNPTRITNPLFPIGSEKVGVAKIGRAHV